MCTMTTIRIPHGIRISPETLFRLKILSFSMKISMGRIVEQLIDSLWEQKQDMIIKEVSNQRIEKEAGRILRKIIK